MKSKEIKLPIGSVANRLAHLDNTLRVTLFAYENSREVTELIVGGFGELIDRFNALDSGSTVMEIIPSTKHLKDVLQGTPIPRPEDFSPREILAGVKDTDGIPSTDTSERALAIGTGGHILERTIFHVMRRSGIRHDWVKDEVLSALGEMALLMHTESVRGHGKDPILFTLISTPNSQGGLGWSTEEHAARFLQNYAALVSTNIFFEMPE